MTSLLAPPLRAGAQSPVPFEREADMLLPLLNGVAHSLPALKGEPFFEVQTLHGVADVVFAEVDREVMSRRSGAGLAAVTAVSEVATLRALLPEVGRGEPTPLQTASLAAITGISVGHLRSRVLPRLLESGWISSERGAWALCADFAPPVRSMAAVEIKRTDWKRALSQANAYTDFSDASYVAMDHSRVRDVDALRPSFNFSGVGLLTVRSDEGAKGVQRRIAAKVRRRRGLSHAVVAERIAALIESGRKTGDVGLVFGQFLTTTTGADPRFQR